LERARAVQGRNEKNIEKMSSFLLFFKKNIVFLRFQILNNNQLNYTIIK